MNSVRNALRLPFIRDGETPIAVTARFLWGVGASMPSKTIDIHPHIIANDDKRYPPAPLGGHQSDWSRLRPVTVDQMIAAMDEAGVDKSAIVQASTCYGHDNSYVADTIAAHPSRFTGVFSVDVLAPDAPERMRYWFSR